MGVAIDREVVVAFPYLDIIYTSFAPIFLLKGQTQRVFFLDTNALFAWLLLFGIF